MRHFQRLGRYEEMLEAAKRGAEIARAIEDDRLLASLEERRGSALTLLGQTERAKPVFEAVIPLLQRVGDLERLQVALANLGEVHRLGGEMDAARHYNERALGVAERVGDPSYVAFHLMNLGEILLTLGDWEEAVEDLARAEEMLGSVTSASANIVYPPLVLGQILLRQGDWEGAGRQLEQALTLGGETGDRQALELIHLALAELDLLRGRSEAAIARLEPLAERKAGKATLIQTILAWAQLEGGEVDRAEELADQAVKRGREQREGLTLPDALRVQGMVLISLERHEEARWALEEGLLLARGLPYPYAEARSLFQLGLLHSQQHEPELARKSLEGALTIFQRLGAKKDIDQMEQALAELARA